MLLLNENAEFQLKSNLSITLLFPKHLFYIGPFSYNITMTYSEKLSVGCKVILHSNKRHEQYFKDGGVVGENLQH